MGLDLTVLPKPKPGHEDEFRTLWRQINEADGKLPKLSVKPKTGLLQRLFGGAGDSFDKDAAVERFHAISDPAFTQLGAPVVGQDAAADAWLQQKLISAGIAEDQRAIQAAQMQGYHVLALVPPCDGLPVYTHGGLYDGVDETSFRGEFLKLAEAVLTDLAMEAYLPMMPEDAVQTGRYMMQRAAEFAEEFDVSHVIGQREIAGFDEGAPETWAHIADQAGRWYVFWGSRGHGIDPYF